MSTPSGSAEISSIKPKPEISGQQDQQEKPELKFSYSTEGYDTYAKEGFEPPDYYRRPDKFEQRFLQQVDITKGKIKVDITRMFRVKALDYSSEKREYKQYLIWESNWYAKNWLENDLQVIPHIEGKYWQMTRKLVRKVPDVYTGRVETYYEKGLPREVHTIPFTKGAVDKLLNGPHPFGTDSVNITDPDKVIYYGKIDHELGVQSFRCADYTYEQFIIPEWKKFVELATRPGGPTGRLPMWMAEPQDFIK